MEKFLFTDSSNGIREVQTREELQELIRTAAQTDMIRIWVFNTQEWMAYPSFIKQFPAFIKKERPVVITRPNVLSGKPANGKRWLKKFLFFTGAAACIFLVFNFTKIKWEKMDPVTVMAARPDNVPLMDIDSLIYNIEDQREEHLDRTTKTNLRIRNNWPDMIQLQVSSDREKSNGNSRYYNMDILIDNSTGYALDNAIVKLTVWKDNKVNSTDTFHFDNINYSGVTRRNISDVYKGDSLSVSFQSIKSKAFNFCYSASTKNNSGNYNDRWFYKE